MTDNPSSSVPPLCRTCGCHPPSFKNFEKQVHCEICVPASSVPVSKGEEIAAGWFDNATGDLSISLVQHQALVSLIDSALASQEARHRQEMEEAKREGDEESAGLRVVISDKERLIDNWHARARAAEQREREAGEREKWMYEAVVSHHQAHGCPTVTRVILDAFAAIRSAPSPVSAVAKYTPGEPCPTCGGGVIAAYERPGFQIEPDSSPVSAPPTEKCWTCGGYRNDSGTVCICGGTYLHTVEVQNMREELMRLRGELPPAPPTEEK